MRDNKNVAKKRNVMWAGLITEGASNYFSQLACGLLHFLPTSWRPPSPKSGEGDPLGPTLCPRHPTVPEMSLLMMPEVTPRFTIELHHHFRDFLTSASVKIGRSFFVPPPPPLRAAFLAETLKVLTPTMGRTSNI